MSVQLSLFDEEPQPNSMTDEDLQSYDRIIVLFSGGKDCTASFLHLLDRGVDRDRIELWHHEIDGREGVVLAMDWPSTPDYCRKFAEAFGVKIFFSWKVGGFEGEMLRENARTKPVRFETPDGVFRAGGDGGREATRRKFPQVSADLSVRWCSAYLKIDVASLALRHQERFNSGRTLVISGERAEESPGRARYRVLEPDRTDNRNGRLRPRYVDHWRPVHGWKVEQVWDIIQWYRVNPAPAYHLGWGRLSCMTCIFGSANQWASVAQIDPDRFNHIARYEQEFGCTIHRSESVSDKTAKGTPYPMDPEMIRIAMSETYDQPIILPDGVEWILPAGAFGEKDGPC